jgi:hypothetical protein
MAKSSDEVQRDYSAYRDWMFHKALKTGMTDVEAKIWAQEQANLQSTLRQRELEERQRAPKKR